MDCIFCKIAAKSVPADIVWEGDGVMAVKDLRPKAEVHVLLIPTRHIQSMAQLTEADTPLIGKLFAAVPIVATQCGVNARGYNLAINTGEEGGQEIPHLHIHLLAGKRF